MRVTWFVRSLGYGDELLYWGPLLRHFMETYPATEVLTTETDAAIPGSGRRVRRMPVSSRFSAFRWWLAIRELWRTRPDLVVISEFGALSMCAAVMRIVTRRFALILLVENDPVFLQAYGLRRDSMVHLWWRRTVVWCADLVLCNTERAAIYVLRRLKGNDRKVQRECYLTSSIPAVADRDRSGSTDLRFLYVGQLVARKGVSNLIEAFAKVCGESHSPVMLDIVGDGAEREELERLVARAGLSAQVVFHGSQPYAELGRFFGAADVFVLPTLGDYRALVGFEAISCGLPMVGSVFDGASDEVVRDGVNGYVIDPTDSDTFAARLRSFIDRPELVRKFSCASFDIAHRYRPELAAQRLVDACAKASANAGKLQC